MLKKQLFLILCLLCAFPRTKATAQIVPDSTLNSNITISFDGTQGTGINLFHSFDEINNFVNPGSIDNIFRSEEEARTHSILVEQATKIVGLSIHRLTIPIKPLDTKINQICTPGTKEARSEFIFTGRGGITPNTLEALQLNPTAPNWVEFSSQSESVSQHTSSTPNNTRSPKIIEAQGWIRAKNGEVILIADASNLTPHSSWQQGRDCGGK